MSILYKGQAEDDRLVERSAGELQASLIRLDEQVVVRCRDIAAGVVTSPVRMLIRLRQERVKGYWATCRVRKRMADGLPWKGVVS